MKITTRKQYLVKMGLILFCSNIFFCYGSNESGQQFTGISGYDVQSLGVEKTLDSDKTHLDITNRVRSQELSVAKEAGFINDFIKSDQAQEQFAGISGYNLQTLGEQKTIGALPDSSPLDITNRVRSEQLTLEEEREIKVKIAGFIKYDAFIDQRKIFGYNKEHTYVYPRESVPDARGNDINNTPDWNMVPVQSRINFEINGPKVFDAKTAGLIAVDFVDPLETSPGVLRLRRSFMTFEWEKDKLLVGHEYHPVSLDDIYPDTVGYSQGELFDPFAYATQLTWRHKVKKALFTLSTSAEYKNESSINTGFFNDFFVSGQVGIGEHLIGAGVDVRAEVPRIVTDKLVTNTSTPIAPVSTMSGLNSAMVYVWGMYKRDNFKMSVRYSYLENGNKYNMLGGTAVTYHNPVTDERKYTNIRAWAFWTELVYRRARIEVGSFFGYTKTLGTFNKIIPSFTNFKGEKFSLIQSSYNPEIDYVLKFQPRIRYYFDPVVIGFELEYGIAGFGKLNDYAKPQNVKTVANPRFAAAVVYNF